MEKNILVIKHAEQEGPGLIESIFGSNGWVLRTVELSQGEKLPFYLGETGALLVLGGPMNVYEEEQYPFLKEEESLIRKALIHGTPVLGICLGAQLLAKTCGARVKKAPQKEVGWYKVKITREGKRDSLFDAVSDNITVFQWHEDTFDIPQGAVLLAEGDDCRNQAFLVGKNAYGLQFHIEATREMVEDWFRCGEKKAVVGKILSDMKKVSEHYEKEAKKLILNFMRTAELSLMMRQVVDPGTKYRRRRSVI
jgi:GMP synthase (glutamine-hydrolysing)